MDKTLQLILTTPLLLINRVRKIKWDGFAGGLIFGSIFSLIVNVITIQIQEKISRQKFYESLENEVVENLSQAKNFFKEIEDNKKNNIEDDPESFNFKYFSSAWNRGVVSGYVYNLDPEIQASLTVYYNSVVPWSNSRMSYAYNLISKLNEDYQICEVKNNYQDKKCASQSAAVREMVKLQEYAKVTAADQITWMTEKVLQNFHPTQDRLKDSFLKFIMGTKRMKSLENPLR